MAEGLAGSVLTTDRVPRLAARTAAEARPDPELRGQAVWTRVESVLARMTDRIGRSLPESANPLARAGAVANTAFLVAVVTGILLLFWYRASVTGAYASLEQLPWFAQLLRSLHRYSSDVCMLFVLFHGLQTLAARKTAGARWLAWTSGALLVGILWLDGWTGYWLVWDERAHLVATATARFLDVLPIFPDPIARSFLVDAEVNTLLFFLVFFIHMLIPLAMGLFLWLHILRVDRSKFLTGPALTVWLLVTLVVASLAAPARSADPASMASIPGRLTGDLWYLGPLAVIERLGGGALWLTLAATTVLAFGIPWLLPRRRVTASAVDAARCNGCTQCWKDCPFTAVSLLPADGAGRKSAFVARIDPSLCVGCGICVGSCDSSAIDLARLPLLDARRWVNHAARKDAAGAPATHVAFVCGASPAGRMELAEDGTTHALPGYRVLPVPCAGWVHMLTVERAIRHGAEGVLIVGCGQDSPCREGADWTAARLAGGRSPALRTDRVDAGRVRFVRSGGGGPSAVARVAEEFRAGWAGLVVRSAWEGLEVRSGRVDSEVRSGRTGLEAESGRVHGPSPRRLPGRLTGRLPARSAVAGAVLSLVVAFAAWAPSDLSVPVPEGARAELVVSFKHAGHLLAAGAAREDPTLLPHMRRPRTVGRERSPVRLLVRIDGVKVLEEAYPPGGLFGDGPSVAVERLAVEPGPHRVEVRVSDVAEPDAWPYGYSETVEFEAFGRRVIRFEEGRGFRRN